MSINPYNNNHNKYDFTIEELKSIDFAWELINMFNIIICIIFTCITW